MTKQEIWNLQDSLSKKMFGNKVYVSLQNRVRASINDFSYEEIKDMYKRLKILAKEKINGRIGE